METLVIDADSHKCENPVVFLEYVARPYRHRVSFVRDRFGEQRIRVLDRDPHGGALRERLFLQPEGWGKGTYRPYHPESTLGGLFNRLRLEHMDREGIDHQVVYGSVALAFNAVSDPELAVALCRAYNDYIAEDCAGCRDRLHPVCVVPLRDPAEAVLELRRGIEDLGMVAAMLPPNLPVPHPAAPQAFPEVRVPRHLSDPIFDPIFEEAQRLDVGIGIHGAPGLQFAGGAGDQLDTFTLVHVFANRDMQQMAMAKLIFDGVMERFPQLRFGFLEAGCGWLPDFVRSLREHWEKRIVQFDPSLEPSRREFLVEFARELGRGRDLSLARRARGLLDMLFTPAAASASPEELERFRYEHPNLPRDPHEYLERGQIFVTAEPDDPAPRHLGQALGPVGKRLSCFAVDYGHWDATLKDCVGLVADNPAFDDETVRGLLNANALRFYGARLQEEVRC